MVIESSAGAERHAALLGVKLRALVGGAAEGCAPAGLGIGVGLVAEGTAWVLVDVDGAHPADRMLGPALAWAVRQGADRLVVMSDHPLGVVARRAGLFDLPVEVRRVDGRSLVAVDAVAVVAEPPVSDAHLGFAGVIAAAGATPTCEHGVLSGEVAGLEVCRAVTDANTGEPRLEVGIGAHDRETFQMLHGARPTLDALRDVVDHVTAHRAAGAPRHPLNLIAASRLLRARLVEQPELLRAHEVTDLAPVSPPMPRTNLKDELPCAAISADGRTLVVCSSGVDLDVVAFAADAAAMHGAERCLIAVPARDVVAIQQRLATLVRVPTQFVPIHFSPVAP
ncbi:MAG: hypothetical protein WCP59_03470 [Actinomycetota bacterium]